MKAAMVGMAFASLLVFCGASAQAASCGAQAEVVVGSTERGSDARKAAVAKFKSSNPACSQAMNEALKVENEKVADSERKGGKNSGKGDDFVLVPVVSGGAGSGSASSY